MKKILLTLMLGIFLISFASATSIGTVQRGNAIQLTQVCGNCTQVNLTQVLYPNNTYSLIGQFPMTENSTNYNFTFSDTNTLGHYFYTTCGDLNTIITCQSVSFEVTPSGEILETSDSITYLILTVGSMLLFLLCLWGAIVLPFRNKRDTEGRLLSVDKIKYFKVGLFFLSYVLFVWFLNLLFSLSNNFSILTQYTAFFEITFVVMNAMSFPLFVFMLILMSVLAWKDLQLKKLLLRGLG